MRLVRLTAGVVILFAFAVSAFAWAPGTHAYVANRLPGVTDQTRADVMFGAVAADINQVLSTDQVSAFFIGTHYGFDQLWGAASQGSLFDRALGIGFVSHSERIGADHYAHVQSHLYPNYKNTSYPGQNGYVWVKSDQLCSLLRSQLSAANMLNGPAEVLLSDTISCHFIVEYAMDLLLRARDPQIGQKLLYAAQHYDAQNLAALFMAGYPTPAYSNVLDLTLPMGVAMAGAEPTWSTLMQMYASALGKPTLREAVPAVAAFLEMLAEQLLKDQLSLFLPPGTTEIPTELKTQLTSLIELALVDAMAICSYDFNFELDLTVRDVRRNLAAYGAKF